MTDTPVDAARLAAFETLQAVTMDGAYANLALRRQLDALGLRGRDAAFTTSLVNGTCRALGTLDAIIEAAGRRSLDTLEAPVVDILRLTAHQLLNMRVPRHAAISSAVDLARHTVGERATGVVNAISRRITRNQRDGWISWLAKDDEAWARALRLDHPEWIVEEFARLLPAEELDAALAANNVAPQPTLVVRPGLAEVAEIGTPTRMSPWGATADGPPSSLSAVREGRAGVQDEGSQLMAGALARATAPGGPWLDMCAGPGGKTALLAGLRPEGTPLVAAELHPHRAELVRKSVAGYPSPPEVVCADATAPAWPAHSFAKVLVDAPCSGLGSLRRRPESRWRRQPEDVDELVPVQERLLESAIESTMSGGVVAWVTCSPHSRETRGVVESVISGRSDVTPEPMSRWLPEVPDVGEGPYLQLWPHRHGTDAMFGALLRIG